MASFFRNTFDNLVNNINTTFSPNSNSSPRAPRTQVDRGQSSSTRASTSRPNTRTPCRGTADLRNTSGRNTYQGHTPVSHPPNPSNRTQQNTSRYFSCPYSRHRDSSDRNLSGHACSEAAPSNMSSHTHTYSRQNASSQPQEKSIDISDIQDPQDINQLSAKQLKIILTRNCVDFKGVFEKEVLREKVMQLWIDCNEKHTSSSATNRPTDHSDDIDESQACKICMEREINCVLLECGHMLTCVTCGRKLAECPICRQNVTRCVRTFRG